MFTISSSILLGRKTSTSRIFCITIIIILIALTRKHLILFNLLSSFEVLCCCFLFGFHLYLFFIYLVIFFLSVVVVVSEYFQLALSVKL